MADNLFQEMEEERRLHTLRIVVRRALFVILALILFCGAGGGIWAWHHHRLVKNQQIASNRYIQAQNILEAASAGHDEAGRTESLKKAGDILSSLVDHDTGGIRFYAAMRLAELRMQQNDEKAALSLWQMVRDAPEAESGLRNLAAYLWLNVQSESLPPETLHQFYQKIIQNNYGDNDSGKEKSEGAGSWAALAREGMVAADLSESNTNPGARAGKLEEARRLLLEIMASNSAPEGVKQRAQLLLQSLNLQMPASMSTDPADRAGMSKKPSEGQTLGDRK